MKWDSQTQHHPWCNFFGAPREGCRQCEGLYRDHPVDDPDIKEPMDLMRKYFPSIIDVRTGKEVGPLKGEADA